jgi:hypothetical protein
MPVVAAVALAASGCGGSGGASTTPRRSSPEAARLVALIKRTGAKGYAAHGHPVIVGSTCTRSDVGYGAVQGKVVKWQGRCRYRYDFTLPNGQRVEYEATAPAYCLTTRACHVIWSAGGRAHVVGHVGG